MATIVLPFAGLIGSLIALGRLGADHEILALEVGGRLRGAALRPARAARRRCSPRRRRALSLFGAPAAQRGLERALDRIARDQPWTQIRAGIREPLRRLAARGARGDRDAATSCTGSCSGCPTSRRRSSRAAGASARPATARSSSSSSTGILVLSPALGPRQFRFDHLATVLPKSDEPGPWESTDPFRALSLEALGARGVRRERRRRRDGATREWHRRLATPVTALLLGLLAAPLFLTRSHFSRAGGSVLGIAGDGRDVRAGAARRRPGAGRRHRDRGRRVAAERRARHARARSRSGTRAARACCGARWPRVARAARAARAAGPPADQDAAPRARPLCRGALPPARRALVRGDPDRVPDGRRDGAARLVRALPAPPARRWRASTPRASRCSPRAWCRWR